jgi:putative protease
VGRESAAHPELLAPAGDWEALRAAVANGADAVYFGLGEFNARLRAANFTVEELPKVIRYLHDHNVKGYVTFNTLVFSEELARAVELLKAIAESGADAVIVQDMGVLRLVRRLAPSLPVHASTQMTLTEARGIEIARQLGVLRVILARELSVEQVRGVAEHSAYPPAGIGARGRVSGTGVPACPSEVELEVFVHGALCVSYSGQCLASLALGGRSGNRGECAQACRLPYQVVVDGKLQERGDRLYPLSPQDLAAYERIEALANLGVRGFKIEGRLKGAAYVAAATQVYRAAIDAALEGRPFSLSAEHQAGLAQGFSRGFTHGFLDGVDHQALVSGRSPKSRGVRIGTVVAKTRGGIVVKAAEAALKPGDGVVFDDGRSEEEPGGRIVAVRPVAGHDDRMELAFRREALSPRAVAVGSTVWKTDDPAVQRRLEQSYARDVVVRPAPLDARMHAVAGEPLRIVVSDDAGHHAEVTWERPLERAEKHPLSLGLLREQLGRLGGTPFELRSVEAEKLDPVMVPKSVLNGLRRRAVEALIEQREGAARHAIPEPNALETLRAEARGRRASQAEVAARLCVLVRTIEQMEAVLGWTPPAPAPGPAIVYCDFGDPGRYAEAVARGRAAGVAVGLATLRIIKPGEERFLEELLACRPDAILARNLAAIAFFRERAPGIPLVGDFSLNIANELAADTLAELGVTRLVPSHDLTWERTAAMLEWVGPERFEVIIHQHVPMFHTQHCLFAACLSKGKDRRTCGRPCRRRVELRDRRGVAHPVLADGACRNTVFHAAAWSAAERVEEMTRAGIRHFRIELLRESARECTALLHAYARRLAGPARASRSEELDPS